MTTEYDARPEPTLDHLGALVADLTVALQQLTTTLERLDGTVGAFDRVVRRADGLLDRADLHLGPLAATQQVGDQIKGAGLLAGQVASAAVKKGVAAGKGLAQRS